MKLLAVEQAPGAFACQATETSLKKSMASIVEDLIVQRGSLKEPLPQNLAHIPFSEALWPWMLLAREKLKKSATDKQLSLLLPDAYFSLEKSLMQKWSRSCSPAMALEMGIARLQKELKGETREERYQYFIQQKLSSSESLQKFFDEYPQLGTLVRTLLLFWEEQVVEFLLRLEEDLPLLANYFNEGNPLGLVRELNVDLGDPHFGGRSVYCVTFENGLSLFYKPKDLKVIASYNAFLAELNQLGLTPGLKSYQVLVRNGYGWEEKIEHAPCHSQEEVSLFYQRTGMLLCVMYLLQGNDVHQGNFIASGEHPVLIDLETLFHNTLRKSNSHEEVVKKMDHSVLSIGMLPMCFLGERGQQGIDLSALGSHEGQKWPIKSAYWKHVNTDEMHLATHLKDLDLDKSKHWVKLGRETILASDHIVDLVEGFEKLHAFFRQNRDFLLRPESALWQMIQSPVRILLRLTSFYFYVQNRLLDPRTLLDIKQSNEVLEMLNQTMQGVNPKYRQQIINEEKRALLQGDIPCFHALPSQGDLYSRERLIAPGALKDPTAQTVIDRLKMMEDKDCRLQTAFIRQAFHARKIKPHNDENSFIKKPNFKKDLSEKIIMDGDLVNLSEEIGKDILDRAMSDKDGALGWIALEPDPAVNQFILRPLSDTLYAGNSGIAVFFAALYALTKKSHWKAAALNSLKQFRKQLHSDSKKWLAAQYGIGGMSGMGGILYALTQVAKLADEPDLLNEALVLIDYLEERHIHEDKQYDIISGSAGLLLALLSFHLQTQNAKSLSLAKLCAEHLTESARDMGDGAVAWGKSDAQPLLGFSHGTAGIAYALGKLAHYLKNLKLQGFAKRALAYERRFFSAEKGNWPDFRNSSPRYLVQWCFGAAGNGLSYLDSMHFYQNQEIMHEIEIAIKTTQENLLSPISHLCCGTFGRIEFLLQAARQLARPALEQQILLCVGQFFHRDDQGKAQFELGTIFEGFYSPGFMVGMAGIGYTLLRIQDRNHALPQVLLLQ